MAEPNHDADAINPSSHPAENKEHKEEKPKSTLESVIEELGSFAKKAITIGAVAAMPFIYNPVIPSHVARAAVATYGFAAGKATANVIQNKNPLEGILWQSATGAMLSAPLAAGFYGLNNLETAVASNYGTATARAMKAGGMVFGLQPAVTTMRTALNYGLGKKFKENWWPSVKNTFKYISLIGAANVLWVYKFGLLAQMAVSMLGSYVINLAESLRGEKGNITNLYRELNPFLYINGAATGTSKLIRNTTKGLTDTIYAFGKTIDGYLGPSKAAPKPAQPAPVGGEHRT